MRKYPIARNLAADRLKTGEEVICIDPAICIEVSALGPGVAHQE